LVWTVVMLAYGTVAMALTIGRWALKGFVHRATGSWLRVLPISKIPNLRPGQPSARK
jgi:hypothetical protein